GRPRLQSGSPPSDWPGRSHTSAELAAAPARPQRPRSLRPPRSRAGYTVSAIERVSSWHDGSSGHTLCRPLTEVSAYGDMKRDHLALLRTTLTDLEVLDEEEAVGRFQMMNEPPEILVATRDRSFQHRLGEAPCMGFLQRIGEIRHRDPIPPRDFREGERKLREVTMPRQGIQDPGQMLPRFLGLQALGDPLSRRHPRGFGLGKPALGWRHHEQTDHEQSGAQH